MKDTHSMQNADEALTKSKEVYVLTSGASMRPMLRQHKDVTVITRLNREPRVNDVLLYRKKGYDRLVLHRLLKIKRDGGFVIRGDNNYFTEYDVKPSDIVGVLKEFYREGKYVSCETDKKYLLYSFYIRHSYPARYLWKIKIRPLLGRIKRNIFR